MLREYLLQKDILSVFVRDIHRSESFCLRVAIHLPTRDVFVANLLPCSSSFIMNELLRLYDLLDSPHWKSIVKSSPYTGEAYGSLFKH